MNIESPPKSSVPDKPQKRRRIQLGVLLVGAFFFSLLAFTTLMISSDKRLIWLTQAELSAASRGGPLTRLKYQVKQWIMPVWKHFQRPLRFVQVYSNILAVSTRAAEVTGLGTPVATNTDGLRAWIVSSSELNAFYETVKTNSGLMSITRPIILTYEGMQAIIQTQTGGNQFTAPMDVSIDVIPKVVPGSVKVWLGVSLTNSPVLSPKTPPLLLTNISIACEVSIPNTGAVILEGGKNANGTNYWLVISPSVLDAQGKPIQP